MHATDRVYMHVDVCSQGYGCVHMCVYVAGDVHVCLCARVHVRMSPGQSGRPSCGSPAALPLLMKIASSDLGQEVKTMLLLLVTGEVI